MHVQQECGELQDAKLVADAAEPWREKLPSLYSALLLDSQFFRSCHTALQIGLVSL